MSLPSASPESSASIWRRSASAFSALSCAEAFLLDAAVALRLGEFDQRRCILELALQVCDGTKPVFELGPSRA